MFKMEQRLLAFFGPFEGFFLAKKLEEREGVLSGFCNKMGWRGEHAIQDLYGFFRGRCGEVGESPTLVGVGFDSSFCQVEAEEFAHLDPERALLKVKSHFALPRLSKDFPEMRGMVGVCSGLDDHVVHIYLEHVADLFVEKDRKSVV